MYLKDSAKPEEISEKIKTIEHVERVKIIPKEKSWNDLKREIDVPDFSNPLPDTLHVKVDKPENIESVFGVIKKYDSVEDMT